MKPSSWAATAAAIAGAGLVSAASLVYSCTSLSPGRPSDHSPSVTLNLCQSAPGVWPAVERLDRVESVSRWDPVARQAVPLEPGTWAYDDAAVAFKARWANLDADATLVVRGVPRVPRTFHLGQFSGSEAELFVVLGSHRALADFEYRWNAETQDLSFRTDLDLEAQTYFVSYPTNQGSASYGNRPFDATFALLQAQWVQEQGERLRRDQGGDYDLDFTDQAHPTVVLRPGQAQSVPAPQVSEPRFGPQEERLGPELGLKLARPTQLTGARVYRAEGSFLEGQSRGGRLVRWASQWYEAGGGQPLVVEVSAEALAEVHEAPWVISVQTFVDRGTTIRATTAWVLVSQGRQQPRVGKALTFDWTDQGQVYRLSLPEGESLETGLSLVAAYRREN